jgi:hypothetical protein
MAWLGREHPELVPRYQQLYARRAYVPAEYRSWLAARVAQLLPRHGLDRQAGGQARKVDPAIATGVPGDQEVGFPAGSLPAGGLPGVRPEGEASVRPPPPEPAEQLTLL